MARYINRNGGPAVGLGTGGLLLILALVAFVVGWGTLALILAILGVVFLFL